MNKIVETLVKKPDKFDEALAKLKADLADPEKRKRMGEAVARMRTAGTSRQKAWD